MTNEDAIKYLNTILEITNNNDCCNVEIDAFYEEAIETAISVLKEKQELTGREYLWKLPKQTLIESACIRWCPYDFGFHTEYSLGDKKCGGAAYMGDCDECWNSKVVDKDAFTYANERLVREIVPQMKRTDYMIVLSGICPKCKINNNMWINRICPNCGYIGKSIEDM